MRTETADAKKSDSDRAVGLWGALETVSGMRDCHRAAKVILGERFQERMIETAAMIRAIAAKAELDELRTTIRLAREMAKGEHEGMVLILIAAYVEMTEGKVGT